MLVDWIAGGFDPVAFWSQTPRGVQLALRGVARRRVHDLTEATLAAWVGAHTNHDGLRDFLAGLDDRPRRALPIEAQARALENMAQGVAVLSLEECRARMRGQR